MPPTPSCTPGEPTTGYSGYCLRGEHQSCVHTRAAVHCACPLHQRRRPKPVPEQVRETKEDPLPTVTPRQAAFMARLRRRLEESDDPRR